MVRPVFISVDPDRDNVGQLRHYAQDFHPRILYLTGTQDQLRKVTKAYRVYFSKVKGVWAEGECRMEWSRQASEQASW